MGNVNGRYPHDRGDGLCFIFVCVFISMDLSIILKDRSEPSLEGEFETLRMEMFYITMSKPVFFAGRANAGE